MPNESPLFDVDRMHRHFSADCFDRTWTLIEKTDRTPADDEAMLLAASASLWHWTQRADRTDKNLSIGHWQLSRVCSLLGRGEDALRHAEQSLQYANGSPPFYIAYAHEAIARAASVLGNVPLFQEHLRQARSLAAAVSDSNERAMLEADLQSLAGPATKRSSVTSQQRVARLYRVILPVSDIEAATSFYRDLLEQPGARVSSGRHYFDCGGVILACFDPRADGDDFDARPNPDYVYFAVSDLDATHQRARRLPCQELDGAAKLQPWGERCFYAKDPFGNPICFVDERTVFRGEKAAGAD
jgi:catechol 2,3-dioxygenase-like lactoylglutathione lyase family enzyme